MFLSVMRSRVSPSGRQHEDMSSNGEEDSHMVALKRSQLNGNHILRHHHDDDDEGDIVCNSAGKDQNYRRKSSASLAGLIDLLSSTFDSPELEHIYQTYFSKRRRTNLRFLLLAVTLYNIVQLIVTSLDYHETKESHLLARIVITVIAVVAYLTIFLVYTLPWSRKVNFTFLPGLLWISVYLQLVMDLLLSYKSLTPDNSVGLFIFFIYVTYAMITFRLYACASLALIAALTHCLIVPITMDNLKNSVILRVRLLN